MTQAVSKKQIAIEIYKKYKDQGRTIVMEKMMEATGMSKACASTYTANCKNGTWNTVDPIDVLKAMSNSELVKMYNSKAEQPIVKFRDKQTALDRIMKLFGGVLPV